MSVSQSTPAMNLLRVAGLTDRDTGRWGHSMRDDASLPSHPTYLGYERGHGVSMHGQQLVKHTYAKLPAGLWEE